MSVEILKKQAALRAVSFIEDGMRVGLGTGSTAKHAIDELGRKLKSAELKDIIAVATSKASSEQAQSLGIPLAELDELPLDIAIDGMDEIDPRLNAIKGLGGALTREKIVESRSKRLILIADDSKVVARLGEKAPIPIEIVPYGYKAALKELASLGGQLKARLNKEGKFFITDNSNYIFDLYIQNFDAYTLAKAIKDVVGVVEHGLFLDMTERAFIASATGITELTGEL